MKDEVFKTWSKFTYYFIPITILLVLFTPNDAGSNFFPTLISKGIVAFLVSWLFVIISLIIVITKLIITHKKNS
jgi:hypothetical protein